MSKVLRIFNTQEELPKVEVFGRHVHEFETPFLTFTTLEIKIDGVSSTVLFSTLNAKELVDNVYLRTTWMRESVCGYLTARPELVDLSRTRLLLSPTLLRHMGNETRVVMIDEIFIGDVPSTTACYQAVLNKLREELRSEGLVISLDWVSYIEYAKDIPPHPSVYAERCGFQHTGLMWISKPLD
ncbi:MAG: hypothetical protein RSG77_17865 [Hafnia sp.]